MNQRFERGKKRLIRSSKQKIFQKDNLGEKREYFLVQRRRHTKCERTFRRERIAGRSSIFAHALREPAARSQQAKGNTQVTPVSVRALDNPIELQPLRRIAENLKYFAVEQRLDHRSENDPAQMPEQGSPNLSLFVI